jgi:hypothetical protein
MTAIGTPVNVAVDNKEVTILFDAGDYSTSITFECRTKAEIRECLDMWTALIHQATEMSPDEEYYDESEEDGQ